jgi:acyl-CoA synthetase
VRGGRAASGRALALAALVDHLRAQGFSVESWPEHLLVFDELPRSSGGKIAKGELRKEAARLLAAEERK